MTYVEYQLKNGIIILVNEDQICYSRNESDDFQTIHFSNKEVITAKKIG